MLTHRILSALSKSQRNLSRHSSSLARPRVIPLSLTSLAVKRTTTPNVFYRQSLAIASEPQRSFATATPSAEQKVSVKISDDDALEALRKHNFSVVDEYLKTNDINKKIVTFYGIYHAPLLHFACYIADTTAMNYLFSKGADVNSNDKNEGRKPLHYVMISGLLPASKAAAVDLLLAQKADINAVDTSKRTALDTAIKECTATAATGITDGLQVLTSRNANVNSRDFTGATTLFHALNRKWQGYPVPPFEYEICDFLLSAGAICNIKAEAEDGKLYNAVDYAWHRSNIRCYYLLKGKCPDISATNIKFYKATPSTAKRSEQKSEEAARSAPSKQSR